MRLAPAPHASVVESAYFGAAVARSRSIGDRLGLTDWEADPFRAGEDRQKCKRPAQTKRPGVHRSVCTFIDQIVATVKSDFPTVMEFHRKLTLFSDITVLSRHSSSPESCNSRKNL
jgi:hypothetical protein